MKKVQGYAIALILCLFWALWVRETEEDNFLSFSVSY